MMEKADGREIVGLAWDKAKQKEGVKLDLFIDDAFIERRVADEERGDLKERGYGNGRFGFRFAVPWWVRDGRPHIVEVREVDSGKTIKGAPQTVEVERNDEEIQREEEKLRRAREAADGSLPAQPAPSSPPQVPAPK